MIFNELPIVFPFYDKLEKQHRFRDVADGACAYKLITPRNALLPFQIKANYNFNEDIFDRENIFNEGYKIDLSGNIVEDNNSVITNFINVEGYQQLKVRSFAGFRVNHYNEYEQLISSYATPPQQTNWDSFILINLSADTFYITIEVSRFESRRDYDKLFFSVVNYNKEIKTIDPGNVKHFKIYDCCGGVIDIQNVGSVRKELFSDGVRYFYGGDVLRVVSGLSVTQLNLGAGYYYAMIENENGDVFYSENFYVPKNTPSKDEMDNYTKITFWNDSDLSPIVYPDIKIWKQEFYTEAECYTVQPLYEEEGERDINDEFVSTFKKLIINWMLTDLVPDYLKIALTSLQMHDNVEIKTKSRFGKANKVSVEIGEENTFGLGSITISIEQYVITQRSCNNNITRIKEGTLNDIITKAKLIN